MLQTPTCAFFGGRAHKQTDFFTKEKKKKQP